VKSDKPFFIWWNSSRMHVFTHLSPKWEGKTGLGIYADGMVEHDGQVGELLAELKKLGVDNNTIVMYSTDNGAEFFNWPDGGTTLFRGEKNTQWEGGFRVPTLIRWPGVIKPGSVINGIGAGFFFPANSSAVMKAAPPEAYGIASGMLRTFANIGMVFSFAVAILIASRSISRGLAFAIFVGSTSLHGALAVAFTSGLHDAFYASMGFMALAAGLSALRAGSAHAGR